VLGKLSFATLSGGLIDLWGLTHIYLLFSLLAALTLPVLACMPEHIDSSAEKDLAKDDEVKLSDDEDLKMGKEMGVKMDKDIIAEVDKDTAAEMRCDVFLKSGNDSGLDAKAEVYEDLDLDNEICTEMSLEDTETPYKKDKDS
jgi:hypothetical protein